MSAAIVRRFRPVLDGTWQLYHLKSNETYCLVHPDGRQAWFSQNDMAMVLRRHRHTFVFTADPLADFRKLCNMGLQPFHVDQDIEELSLKKTVH